MLLTRLPEFHEGRISVSAKSENSSDKEVEEDVRESKQSGGKAYFHEDYTNLYEGAKAKNKCSK